MQIGVLGGGQLGQMLALAGIALGHEFTFLDPDPNCPAASVGRVVVGAYDDPQALAEFVSGLDVATYEFENVSAEAVRRVAQSVPLAPSPTSLAASQDRVLEKEFFSRCGIPVQAYVAVSSQEELARACGRVGFPGVLKTRRMGYDGKGQFVVKTPVDVPGAWKALGGGPCIYEEFVHFAHELSAIAVRGRDGSTAFYPLCQNVHERGILRSTLAPAPDASAATQAAAQGYMQSALDALGHEGVLTIEFFATAKGLIANEMAPRVHNSGHWTQEGAVTSQFENHVRAITGAPIGCTDVRGVCGLVNLIGGAPPLAQLLSVPGARVHLYGKQPRSGRKLGHVNICAPSTQVRDAQMRVVMELARTTADG
jgi:5-(carboxyamino)imidazole ribonucleotide synthase